MVANPSTRASYSSRSLAWLFRSVVVLFMLCSTTAHARVIEISPFLRAGPPQGGTGDGLLMRFKDVTSGCGLDLCREATDTVTVEVTTMPNINFLLNEGCTI